MSDSLTAMPDANTPPATPAITDPNTTPVVTPQPPPQLTPPSVAPLVQPFVPRVITASFSSSSPTTPAPITNVAKMAPAVAPAAARTEQPLPTGVMPRPSVGVRAETASSPSPSSMSAPVVAAVVPKLDDAPGPITKRQRAFFASTPRVEVSGAKRSPPLVPLPKKPANLRPSEQIEMSGGVLVIERTSPAWIATAVVAAAGLVIALVLGLDASAANEKLAAKEAEANELAKKVAALEIPKVVAPTAAASPIVAAPADTADAQPIADAVRARIAAELTRGDAKIVVDGAQVKVTLEGVLDKKGKLAKKAPELLGRVGAALGPLAKSVDVAAYSEGNVGRGKSEWGQSAARATNVARALAENARALDAKKVAVVGKGAPPKGVSARRVELVVTAR